MKQRSKRDIELFWHWINERHRIWLKRQAGEPYPWTEDPVLQKYKFTNVFRSLDRVSVEWRRLVAEVWGRQSDAHELVWRTIVFRLFNWPGTYQSLDAGNVLSNWSARRASTILRQRVAEGEQVFTGAYIVTNGGRSTSKIQYAVESLDEIHGRMPSFMDRLLRCDTLESACTVIRTLPMHGAFTAYEVACDLRWTKVLGHAADVMTWANPGPGARRGVHRILYGEPARRDNARLDYLGVMRDLLKASVLSRGDHVPALEMRDIEHSLCEFDKYRRVQMHQGEPRSLFHMWREKK